MAWSVNLGSVFCVNTGSIRRMERSVIYGSYIGPRHSGFYRILRLFIVFTNLPEYVHQILVEIEYYRRESSDFGTMGNIYVCIRK